jgi:hypothetical protein
VQVALLAEDELLAQAAGLGSTAERMGLTPDWIISTAAFNVFQLPVRGGMRQSLLTASTS